MKPSPMPRFVLLAVLASTPLAAQIPTTSTAVAAVTPPAVLPPAAETNLTSVVRGSVVYPDGAPVSAADLTLTAATGATLRTTTDPDGTFTFFQVPPGEVRIAVSAEDLEPATTIATLSSATTLDLPPISLRVTATVSVNAISQEEAAERDVRQAETQRLLGAIPNFFIVYNGGDGVPLSASQKYRLSLRTLFDPSNIAISAIMAGGEQASGSYAGFGHGPAGYARRFGASFGDAASSTMLSSAILPSLFHQDPRYFVKGTGSATARVGYVIKNSFEQKGDNGHWQFGWSNVLGNLGSALISNTYYPNQSDKWATLTGENLGLAVASQGIANLLQEFVLARLTTHRPQ